MKQTLCFSAADILLPDFKKTDPRRWAVVACDQFTSEPEYWEEVEQVVGDAPSTLRMILPEVYLSEAEARIPCINDTMQKYDPLLLPHTETMVYLQRTQSNGLVRHGLLLTVDLEHYDFRKGASSLIRATEATVLERIPPRVAVRRNASIELPHVMLLIDDPQKTVIEPLADSKSGELLYDTELMLGGGALRGRALDSAEIRRVSRALSDLCTSDATALRYGREGLAPLLFAVGDGNHSLATAKATYEELKERIGAEAAADHPARYALAEVVNLHDAALHFEPIYRVLFGVEPEAVLSELADYLKTLRGDAAPQQITWISGDRSGELCADTPLRQLTVGTLQDFIDRYLSDHPQATVDYIHGEDSVRKLAAASDALGFLFTGMEKFQLFPTVMLDGSLPRKTFSMGSARDKRYYMECRRIVR